jgi:hypothetical protein
MTLFEKIKVGTRVRFNYLFEADGFERGLDKEGMSEVDIAREKLVNEFYGDVDENDDLVPREIEVDGVVVELSNDNSEEDIEMTIKLSKKTYCAGWSCHENNNFRSVEAEENFTFEFRKVRLNWCVSFCQYHDGEKISKPITLD